MKTWIRRNCRALLVSVLMVVLIAITITRPAWQDNIGYLRPRLTVPYGHSTVLGGVRWQLISVKPPDKRELEKYMVIPEDVGDEPPNTRLVTYLMRRDKAGKPAGVPAGYSGCDSAAMAGNRRWTKTSSSMAVVNWAMQQGYTTICSSKFPGPLLLALIVPADVHISSINIEFVPDSWGDQTQMSKSTDLLVVGFHTN